MFLRNVGQILPATDEGVSYQAGNGSVAHTTVLDRRERGYWIGTEGIITFQLYCPVWDIGCLTSEPTGCKIIGKWIHWEMANMTVKTVSAAFMLQMTAIDNGRPTPQARTSLGCSLHTELLCPSTALRVTIQVFGHNLSQLIQSQQQLH